MKGKLEAHKKAMSSVYYSSLWEKRCGIKLGGRSDISNYALCNE